MDNYQKIASNIDDNVLKDYSDYVLNYLDGDSVENDNMAKKNYVQNVSFLSPTDWETASEIIKRNSTAIKNAGVYYEVNPAIIAACIYTEQITNVNALDTLTDVPAYFADTSIGIGQVKVSTARMLEDEEYPYMRELLGLDQGLIK